MSAETLSLANIRVDGGTQSRDRLAPPKIKTILASVRVAGEPQEKPRTVEETGGVKGIPMLNLVEEQQSPVNNMAAERRWLDAMVRKGEGGIFAIVHRLTPALARLLLLRNPPEENRKLKPNSVGEYVSEMRSGRWVGLNGSTIVVSKCGRLNDGQNRLNAVVEAGVEFDMLFVFGADRISRMTLDQNANRTNGDYLHMAGVEYANAVAATAKILLLHDSGRLYFPPAATRTGNIIVGGGRARPSKARIHEYALAHETEITNAIKFANATPKPKIAAGSGVSAAYVLLQRNAADSFNDKSEIKQSAHSFMEAVAVGEGLTKTDAAYVARARLFREKEAGTAKPTVTIEVIARAWNAHRSGNKMSRINLHQSLPAIAS